MVLNYKLASMLAEFAAGVYAPARWPNDDLHQSSGKGANVYFTQELEEPFLQNTMALSGFRVVKELHVHGKGIKTFFGCVLYKLSEFDEWLQGFLEQNAVKSAPERTQARDSEISVLDVTAGSTMNELRDALRKKLATRQARSLQIPDNSLQQLEIARKTRDKQRSILIAFRGTMTLGDWLTDAHAIRRVHFHFGDVHHGFMSLYRSFQQTLLDTVRSLLPKDQELKGNTNIYVTGHSLGGALATLCTADLLIEVSKAPIPVCYTFGSPRVGSPDFANSFNRFVAIQYNQKINSSCSVRIYHQEDPIPYLPPELMGFKHVENSWCLDEAQARRLLKNSAHYIDNYREVVEDEELSSVLNKQGWKGYTLLHQTGGQR